MNAPWATVPNATGKRVENDFYPTPPECLYALMPRIPDFPWDVWEPACGDGSLAKVLRDCDFEVVATDLFNRGCDGALDGMDFLKFTRSLAPAIITNPPYGKDMAEAFIRQSFSLGVEYVALLLKANFWHARRGGLFEEHPPSRIHPLTWRPDFTRKGAPFLDVAWNVWRPGCSEARVVRLKRPES